MSRSCTSRKRGTKKTLHGYAVFAGRRRRVKTTGLTMKKLLQAKRLMDSADVPHEERTFEINPRSPVAKALRIEACEALALRAVSKLSRLKDPEKKLRLLWQLAWGPLRELEDFRPAGGFK